MKGQYWGTVEGKPANTYWIICEFTRHRPRVRRLTTSSLPSEVWQSRAHAAAFAADPSYPEFVQRRESLATTPVRDIHVPVSGATQPYIEAPVTEVVIYTTQDTGVEKAHEVARTSNQLLQSLKPTGFRGSTCGVTLEDPKVGLHIAGWNTVQVRFLKMEALNIFACKSNTTRKGSYARGYGRGTREA